MMGSDSGKEDEAPAHRVTVPSFYMGKYPVTNAQFRRFVAAGYVPKSGHKWKEYADKSGENCPVVCVTWDDACGYCNWASLRLPAEAEWEWEYAARGPQSLEYPWGNSWDPDRLWWAKNSGGRAQPVVSKLKGASWRGCLDMAGNVWQWTASWYERYPGNSDSNNRYYGQTCHVVRGGSWYLNDAGYFRGANRYRFIPVLYFDVDGGFRVAKTL